MVAIQIPKRTAQTDLCLSTPDRQYPLAVTQKWACVIAESGGGISCAKQKPGDIIQFHSRLRWIKPS